MVWVDGVGVGAGLCAVVSVRCGMVLVLGRGRR